MMTDYHDPNAAVRIEIGDFYKLRERSAYYAWGATDNSPVVRDLIQAALAKAAAEARERGEVSSISIGDAFATYVIESVEAGRSTGDVQKCWTAWLAFLEVT